MLAGIMRLPLVDDDRTIGDCQCRSLRLEGPAVERVDAAAADAALAADAFDRGGR